MNPDGTGVPLTSVATIAVGQQTRHRFVEIAGTEHQLVARRPADRVGHFPLRDPGQAGGAHGGHRCVQRQALFLLQGKA